MNDLRKRRRGRPTKLTPELQERVCTLLSVGNTIETSCTLAGIHVDTLYAWCSQGEAGKSSRHHEFSEAIKKARASAEAHHIQRIYQGERNWQSSAWWLERANPRYRLPREIPSERPEAVPVDEMIAVVNKALDEDPTAKAHILRVLEEMK